MCSSASTRFINKTLLLVAATLTVLAGVGAAANAATQECGARCISVYSSELGNAAQPNFVEAVLDGGAAEVGQPVGLKRASRFDASEDITPLVRKVSAFHADGMVSAAVNAAYGGLDAVQQMYAPLGIPTNLCVGLAAVAHQNQGLTLQPCGQATTVWIIHRGLSPSTPGVFPIINGSTTEFDRPFAMHLPRNEVASGRPLQMQVRRLQFRTGEDALPPRQLWGVVPGVLTQ